MHRFIDAPDCGLDDVGRGDRMARAAVAISKATGDSYAFACGPTVAEGVARALSVERPSGDSHGFVCGPGAPVGILFATVGRGCVQGAVIDGAPSL